MSDPEIMVRGKVLLPLITKRQALGRPFLHGEDEQGEYVACRIGARNPSTLYGWYVFVSPEDLPLMKEDSWCGHIAKNGESNNVIVRRSETVDGKQYRPALNRDIWTRTYDEDPPEHVYRIGHPLDFRRMNLTKNKPPRAEPTGKMYLRGLTWRERGFWFVQLGLRGESHYVGVTKSPDEGYRMFNRYLRDLKEKNPDDAKIQALLYNEIEPQF